jgi:hypothetical protein
MQAIEAQYASAGANDGVEEARPVGKHRVRGDIATVWTSYAPRALRRPDGLLQCCAWDTVHP